MTQPDKQRDADAAQQADMTSSSPSWIERNVNLVIWGLVIACVLSLVAEPVFGPFFDDHHPAHFELEKIFGYQAVIGFVAFVAAVFLGKALRLIVRREEDYYDR